MASSNKEIAPAAAPRGEVVPIEFDKSTGLVNRFAAKYGVDGDKMLKTLKDTAFRQRPAKDNRPQIVVTNEHMMMLLIVAERYELNPFVREIYAFPQENGIVPIIGFDGWITMINKRPELEYIEIREAPDGTDKDDYYVETEIKRKDRERPTVIREYLKECYRNTEPWNEMPRRMTRHKSIIQCGRIAFGYSGIFDPDDAERVYANAIDVTPRKEPSGKPQTQEPQRKSKSDERTPSAGLAHPHPSDAPRISLDQQNVIADKLKEEGVALNLLLAKFEINALEDLPAASYAAALAVIDDVSTAS
jgi:hypothetical protein